MCLKSHGGQITEVKIRGATLARPHVTYFWKWGWGEVYLKRRGVYIIYLSAVLELINNSVVIF